MTVDVEMLRETRIANPDAIVAAPANRRSRELGERLMLVAADHPARGCISARGRPDAMADRSDLLDRLVTALARPGVDGVLKRWSGSPRRPPCQYCCSEATPKARMPRCSISGAMRWHFQACAGWWPADRFCIPKTMMWSRLQTWSTSQ